MPGDKGQIPKGAAWVSVDDVHGYVPERGEGLRLADSSLTLTLTVIIPDMPSPVAFCAS
jgi:hypothetical protein